MKNDTESHLRRGKWVMGVLVAVSFGVWLCGAGKTEAPSTPPATSQKTVANILHTLPAELRKACGCESSYEGKASADPQQFEKNGNVRTHKNDNGTVDYGACMLNSVHIPEAKELGLDIINNFEHNILMAKRVYETQGIKAFYAYNPNTGACVWQKQYQNE